MNRVKVVTCTALIIFSLAIVAIQAQTLTVNKSDKQANNHTEVITQNEEGKVVKELNENSKLSANFLNTQETKLFLNTQETEKVIISPNTGVSKQTATKAQAKKAKKAKKLKAKRAKAKRLKAKKAKKLKAKKKVTKKKTKLRSLGTFKITGYCPCSSCCGKSNGITASGKRATAGRTLAADTSKLPMGTKVVINGHTYTVEDVGGGVRGNHIDMFFSSHSAALQWGVRYVEVFVAR